MVAELVNKCMSERVSKKVQSLVNDEGPPSAPLRRSRRVPPMGPRQRDLAVLLFRPFPPTGRRPTLLLAASPRRPPNYDANVTPFGGRKQSGRLFLFICRCRSALRLTGRPLPRADNRRLTRPVLAPGSSGLAPHAG